MRSGGNDCRPRRGGRGVVDVTALPSIWLSEGAAL